MLEYFLMVSLLVITESSRSGESFSTILIITNIRLLSSVDSDVKYHMRLSWIEDLAYFAFVPRGSSLIWDNLNKIKIQRILY